MKKLQYALYAIIIIIVVALVGADYYPDQIIEQNTITRAALLVVGTILSIIKTATRSSKDVANKKSAYSKAYPEFIGNAFSHSPNLEKEFYNAVDDYNHERSASCIKRLEKLRLQCQTSEDIYATTVFQALCYEDLQLHQNAIDLYQSAIQLKPLSTLSSNMGMNYAKLGMSEEASASYLQAIQLDPENAIAYNNLAQLYIAEEQYAKAFDYAKLALDKDPKLSPAYSAITIASYMLGDMEGYEKYYRQAVANGRNGEALKEYIRSLDPTL